MNGKISITRTQFFIPLIVLESKKQILIQFVFSHIAFDKWSSIAYHFKPTKTHSSLLSNFILTHIDTDENRKIATIELNETTQLAALSGMIEKTQLLLIINELSEQRKERNKKVSLFTRQISLVKNLGEEEVQTSPFQKKN
ncbi:CLUMA_CG019196, isoform A [Clunio marinus]|uniref:CLUMA_CG019196, isoform A n=1 Tax=Clunio marinus TaxID=568069 RepID=A0A1J1J0B3_9DIPT|nr:CLUMA_CG019196, isoform A [Clunio marinus]